MSDLNLACIPNLTVPLWKDHNMLFCQMFNTYSHMIMTHLFSLVDCSGQTVHWTQLCTSRNTVEKCPAPLLHVIIKEEFFYDNDLPTCTFKLNRQMSDQQRPIHSLFRSDHVLPLYSLQSFCVGPSCRHYSRSFALLQHSSRDSHSMPKHTIHILSCLSTIDA